MRWTEPSLAMPFDVDTQTLTSGAVQLVEGVRQWLGAGGGLAQFDVSMDGSLVFLSGGAEREDRSLVWVGRDGREEPLWEALQADQYFWPRFSPNGTRVAVAMRDDVVGDGVARDLWVLDLERGARSRITFAGNNRFFLEAILQHRQVVAPIDVLVGMGLLTREQLEKWRRGRVPYLERVIDCDLTRLRRLLRILRFHAHELDLVPSTSGYMRWGKGPKRRLRFTKTGEPKLAEAYATHFVWSGEGPFHPPAPTEGEPMSRRTVDIEKLRVALRRLSRGNLLIVAERATALVPRAKLRDLIGDMVRIDELAEGKQGVVPLLAEVRKFHEASLRGEYYESFNVNSRNFMEKSEETQAFIAEFDRLLGKCIRAAERRGRAPVRESFDLLLGLLRRIDADPDAVVFFADEAGSWQVGVDWRTALPAYFRCLADDASPDDFAREVDRTITDFADYERPRLLAAARRVGSAEQKAALRRLPARERRR